MLRSSASWLGLVAAGLLAAATIGAATSTATAQAGGATSCASSTLSTIESVDARVATHIYDGELGSTASNTEANTDIAHVVGSAALIEAVASGDRSATLAAVKALVYHPSWHIVRLRVLNAAGVVLADVGGPYVIAPVTGVLQSAGATVGSYVMSVQDDLGFAKLTHAFTGDPVGIYVQGKLVVERGGSFPRLEPAGADVNVGGAPHGVVIRSYNAFPTGTLDAAIAVPRPAQALTSQPCSEVNVGEVTRVAQRIAALFTPLAGHYATFVEVVTADTGALVVVRLGLRVIASSDGPGPPTLPAAGTVSYLGKSWSVFSFAPTPPAEVFLLIP